MTNQTTNALVAEIDRLKLHIDHLTHDAGRPANMYVGQYLLERLKQIGIKVCSSCAMRPLLFWNGRLTRL
jgi:hypothetical protein